MKKIIFIMMFIFVMMLSTSFAASIEYNNSIYDDYMSYDMAKSILNYFSNSEYCLIQSSSVTSGEVESYYEILKKIDYKQFSECFNVNFFAQMKSAKRIWGKGEKEYCWDDVFCYPYMKDGNFYFLFTVNPNNSIYYTLTQSNPTSLGLSSGNGDRIYKFVFTFQYNSNSNSFRYLEGFSKFSASYLFNKDYRFSIDIIEKKFDNPFFYSFGMVPLFNVNSYSNSFEKIYSWNYFYDDFKNIFNGCIDYFYHNGVKTVPKATFESNNITKSIYLYSNAEPISDYPYSATRIYMQKLTAEEALKCDNECSEGHIGTDIDLFSESASTPGQIFLYEDLVTKMEKGYIYRIVYFYIQKESDISVDGVQDLATSEFFSLNDWNSNRIEVKNLLKYVNGTYPVNPDISGDSSGDTDVNIGGYIDSVNDTIKDTILGTEDENGNRTGGLLGGIGNFFKELLDGLLNGIKSFFIPEDGYFEQWFNDLLGFVKDKLGFLGDIIVFIPELWKNISDLCNALVEIYIVDIPTISLPDFQGSEVVILQGFQVDVYQLIHSSPDMSYLYTLYLNLIDFFVMWALIQYGLSVLGDLFDIDFSPEEEKEPIGFKASSTRPSRRD